jgi:hypothetical protein
MNQHMYDNFYEPSLCVGCSNLHTTKASVNVKEAMVAAQLCRYPFLLHAGHPWLSSLWTKFKDYW